MNHLLINSDSIDIDKIKCLVGHENCGAISIFIGTTRDSFDGKKVISLEYEAYQPMAIKAMQSICDDIRQRWEDVVDIAIHHRIGLVPVCDSSVVIAISSPHRQSSLEATAYAIDELKKRVPIWKKENYEEFNFYKEVKKQPLDFSTCPVQNEIFIPHNLIQISVEDNKVHDRILCYLEKKRKEVDIQNGIDFSNKIDEVGNGICARTNSTFQNIKGDSSKCHLRVQRIKNLKGPQTRFDYLRAINKLMYPKSKGNFSSEIETDAVKKKEIFHSSSHIEERLRNIQHYLNINTDLKSKDIYNNLKLLEHRLLTVESTSAEYNRSLVNNIGLSSLEYKMQPMDHLQKTSNTFYSVNDMNKIINKMVKGSNVQN